MMMRTMLAFVASMALAGCKKEGGGAPQPAQPVDAQPQPRPVPDAAVAADPEKVRRAGKKTGLGAAHEPVEVATEDLIQAISEGNLKAADLIDPALGIHELIDLPGGGDRPEPKTSKRLCGKQAAEHLQKVATQIVARHERDPDAYEIDCSNEFVATADPAFVKDRAQRYASCSQSGPAEYDASYVVYFFPDAGGHLKLVGILVTEGGSALFDEDLASLAVELGKPGCK